MSLTDLLEAKNERESLSYTKREALTKMIILADKFGENDKLKHTGKVLAKWHLRYQIQ